MDNLLHHQFLEELSDVNRLNNCKEIWCNENARYIKSKEDFIGNLGISDSDDD